jgi:hypothetical protein
MLKNLIDISIAHVLDDIFMAEILVRTTLFPYIEGSPNFTMPLDVYLVDIDNKHQIHVKSNIIWLLADVKLSRVDLIAAIQNLFKDRSQIRFSDFLN